MKRQKSDEPLIDPELQRALTTLSEQASSEPISPQLLRLVRQLEKALARNHGR